MICKPAAERDQSLFEGTAGFYRKYRLGYPDSAINLMCERCGCCEGSVVLDLGCGTGQLALPLHERGMLVHAVDPDLEMLQEGLKAEQERELRGVRWITGADSDLEQLRLPKVDVCVMGASFHWMDRPRCLDALDTLVAGHGVLAVFSGGLTALGQACPPWNATVERVIREFLGPVRRAGKGFYKHPAERHEEVLSRSRFSHVTIERISVPLELSVEQIVGLQLSTSYASPALLGDRLDDFKRRLAEALNEESNGALFSAQNNVELIIAKRP